MLLALFASAGHAAIMATGTAGIAVSDAAPAPAMACCDEAAASNAHATAACAGFIAPAGCRFGQPQVGATQPRPPLAAAERHGLTHAPPLTPPRHGIQV